MKIEPINSNMTGFVQRAYILPTQNTVNYVKDDLQLSKTLGTTTNKYNHNYNMNDGFNKINKSEF